MTWTRKEADERRAIILAGLKAVGGNVTRAAEALGCTRQTLYSHATKLGLQREFGLLDPGAEPKLPALLSSKQTQTVPADLRVPISIRVRESVWRRMRHEAIDRDVPAGDLAEQALEEFLAKAKPGAS